MTPEHQAPLDVVAVRQLAAEISLPKLLIAFTLLMVVPGRMLGVAPIVAAIWLGKLSSNLTTALAGFWPAVLLAIVIVVGWFGGRPLFRLAENSFWSLNSLAIQPAYTIGREAQQLAEGLLPTRASKARRSRLRAAAALVSGGVICAIALVVLIVVWPRSDLLYGMQGVGSLEQLAILALANSVVLVAAYLMVVSAGLGRGSPTRAWRSPAISTASTSASTAAAPGASRTFPTCMSRASATASGSKAAGRDARQRAPAAAAH